MKKTKLMACTDSNTIKANGEFENYGIKMVTIFLLMMFTFTASAQKSKVMDAFFKYGIDSSILNLEKTKRPDNYAFNFKQTIITSASEVVTIAEFDPGNSKAGCWTVISIDGKAPSKSAINTFRKNQNKPSPIFQIDDASYKIEKETADQLVVSYKLDPSKITKDNGFIKDCRFYMVINLKSKKLDQIQTLNEKPVKVTILTADKFDLVVKYKWDDQAKQYLPVNEKLHMEAKFIGQATNIETITEYSNYIKK
ncbi:hypothetical protein OIU83_18875 [Flavobacterium sp. LS1R49]|uniref:Uncharacterized protein n=1 Tax=Flavobacterium shii TaxID=2987687 RepID=A0A9X2ZJ99_9FLAO|nr:hypothetical protein [Flavobacterium shii]MCV9929732.1 hypothetical protein [Flavobacterium shii]